MEMFQSDIQGRNTTEVIVRITAMREKLIKFGDMDTVNARSNCRISL